MIARSMRVGALSLATLGMTVNAACINFRPPPPPIPPELAGSPPVESWAIDAGRGASNPMAAGGGHLLLAGMDRGLRAVELDGGREIWSTRLPGAALGGALLRDSVLYVGTARPEGRVSAYVAATGRRLWRASSGHVATPLAAVAGLIAAVNDRGELVAIDARTGEIRWRRRLGPSRTGPSAAGSALVLAVTGDSLLRVELQAGGVTHRLKLDGMPLGEWHPFGDLIVAATDDSMIVALRPGDLSIAWRADVGAPVTGPLGFSGDTIWAVTRHGTVQRVVAPAGSAGSVTAEEIVALDWAVTSGITPAADVLLIGGADGVLRGLRRDGSEAWRLSLTWNITTDPVPVTGGFIAIGGDGDLHRYLR